MIREAISKIQEMALSAQSEMVKVHGLSAFKTSNGVKYLEPLLPASIKVNTLSGIGQYLETAECPKSSDDIFIVIRDYDHVDLVTALDEYANRATLVACIYESDPFPYGRYMPVEDFIINVQTKFVQTIEKGKLIDFVSSVKGDTVKRSEDDGISQQITVLDKVGRLDGAKTEPIVLLRPFRTFHEVEQPESPFLLRMKAVDGNTMVALHEADNGRWKTDAIGKIRAYLLSDPIISEQEIKVIG